MDNGKNMLLQDNEEDSEDLKEAGKEVKRLMLEQNVLMIKPLPHNPELNWAEFVILLLKSGLKEST